MSLLCDENWTSILNCKEVNDGLEKFDSLLNIYIAQATYEINVNKRKIPIKLWITAAIVVSIEHGDKLKLRTDRKPLSGELFRKYRKYRDLLNETEKKLKTTTLMTK